MRGLPPPAPDDVVDLEVVEDLSRATPSDEGFLRVRRLTLRNVRRDGSRSRAYPCDVVSRSRTDAVAIVLYETDRAGAGATPRPGRVRVALKVGVRAPIFLRRRIPLTQADTRAYDVVAEIVAGMLEPEDVGRDGVAVRAVHEASEEVGIALDAADVLPLGAESFASPGVTDEKVHFRAARADLERRTTPGGDGSVMEEGTRVIVLPVEEALAACRLGEIPDMKTEIGLARLCDAIGYLPAFGLFVDELPASLAATYRPPGLDRLP